MSSSSKNLDEQLKNSYLNCIQALQFSKDSKTSLEVAETEQAILLTKCYAASKNDTVSAILEESLNTYTNIVDDSEVNNYWPEFKRQNLNIKNDPTKWVSGLVDVSRAISFVTPLSCQTISTSGCKNAEFANRHIEKFMKLWQEDEKATTTRKLTSSTTTLQQSELKKSFAKQQVSTTSTFQPIERSNKIAGNQSLFQPNSNSNNNSSNIQKYPRHVPANESRNNFVKNAHNNKMENMSKNEGNKNKAVGFKTAREELNIQLAQKNKQQPQKKTLGGKSSVNSKYICPLKRDNESNGEQCGNYDQMNVDGNETEEVDERLKNIDPKMIELVKNEIMDSGSVITWDDIAGLEYAKKIIKEIVVFPMLRPDIFTGLRRPPKGILLFGPPGTGKTLIGKCIASQSKSTFFSISASSLTSKWIGEGEKMVRALFAVARVYQPAVVFIDEIDSLLTQRSETEHESSRRIKTEFLVQLDGAATGEEDRILIVGATNRPYELDEAARRRLVKRLYIPLPEHEARGQIVKNLLKTERHDLTLDDVEEIAKLTEGYSGADVTNLCKEASMGPIRSIPFSQLENISTDEVRHVTMEDFIQAIQCVRPSVSQSDLSVYLDWDKTYGTGSSGKY